MAAAGALTSDHVNLMILRYLEEHGHETTANAFWRDWHRPQQHSDPETFPFAPAVQRNELVSVIQHGLVYDDLQSRVRKNERRFRWTETQDGVERKAVAVENGTISRPPSSGKRRERPSSSRPNADFTGPAPKRQRRSEGHDARVNGNHDTMDIDVSSPSAGADDDADRGSTVPASEPDASETVERYDSMDVAVQTEAKGGPKTDTLYWKVDKPGANILHSMWSPTIDSSNAKTLLTVGESLCRLYQVPDSTDISREITHVDESNMLDEFFVTAAAWRPDGRGAAFAVSGISDFDGSKTSAHILVEHSRDRNEPALELKSPMLETSGIVSGMQYSPDAQYLLVVRTNLKRGWVQIWKTARSDSDPRPPFLHPIAWHVFDRQVLDIAWTASDRFLVSGEDGLAEIWQIATDQQPDSRILAAGDARSRGLSGPLQHGDSAMNSWNKVRYDQRFNIAVYADTKARHLMLRSMPHDGNTAISEATVNLSGELTALAFQAFDARNGKKQSLLAVACADAGTCVIYDVFVDHASADVICENRTSLFLSDGPALALAWSPTGDHIAVGNTDLVQIWRIEAGKPPKYGADALVTWRPASEIEEAHNPYHDRPISEPSLSWSADGESLAFTADNQIAVIHFRPPLYSGVLEDMSNGER